MVASIIKNLVDLKKEEDLDRFRVLSMEGNSIETEKLFLGHTISKDKNDKNSEYLVLIDSSVEIPHSKFFIDIISGETIGYIYGWSGFDVVDSKERAIDSYRPLAEIVDEKVVSLDRIEELLRYLNDKNNKVKVM